MIKRMGESPLTYEDIIKAAEVGDAAFHRWKTTGELANRLSYKSALFVEKVCEVLNKYPKKPELCQITTNSWSPLKRITNGYFTVMYNPIRGECFVSVTEDNIPLRNYLDSGGDCHVTNLEELEKFCEVAKFIGGMGDEH